MSFLMRRRDGVKSRVEDSEIFIYPFSLLVQSEGVEQADTGAQSHDFNTRRGRVVFTPWQFQQHRFDHRTLAGANIENFPHALHACSAAFRTVSYLVTDMFLVKLDVSVQ